MLQCFQNSPLKLQAPLQSALLIFDAPVSLILYLAVSIQIRIVILQAFQSFLIRVFNQLFIILQEFHSILFLAFQIQMMAQLLQATHGFLAQIIRGFSIYPALSSKKEGNLKGKQDRFTWFVGSSK
jgi:hypothetical protein